MTLAQLKLRVDEAIAVSDKGGDTTVIVHETRPIHEGDNEWESIVCRLEDLPSGTFFFIDV